MRKIEQEMNAAIRACKNWVKDNTGVYYETAGNPNGPRSEIYLHGNHIADYWHKSGELNVNMRTLIRWPTNTTLSRLRALGANLYTKRGTIFLDGVAIT